jgi:predicted nucleotidyltransferase
MTYFSREIQDKIMELCKRNKGQELCLFGSRVRGDAGPGSDYDFLVDFIPNSGVSLLEFSAMRLELEDLLGTHVDLVSKSGLKKRIRPRVLSEAKCVYAG